MSRHSEIRGIPDRWQNYTAVGKRLQGTRFIAFKVPLKQSLTLKLPRREAFGPWELLAVVGREKQEVGLVIDITNTARYYGVQDLPESLLLVKILTKGHEIPSDRTILSFKRAVRHFLRDNADNDRLIGVHCTHGLNRTGYLICRYLIDVDGMDPQQAIKLFNAARGHDMERQNYVDDLQRGPKRSNAGMEEAEQEPRRGVARCPPQSRGRSEERTTAEPDHTDHSLPEIESPALTALAIMTASFQRLLSARRRTSRRRTSRRRTSRRRTSRRRTSRRRTSRLTERVPTPTDGRHLALTPARGGGHQVQASSAGSGLDFLLTLAG